jgi:hypothetical protein
MERRPAVAAEGAGSERKLLIKTPSGLVSSPYVRILDRDGSLGRRPPRGRAHVPMEAMAPAITPAGACRRRFCRRGSAG